MASVSGSVGAVPAASGPHPPPQAVTAGMAAQRPACDGVHGGPAEVQAAVAAALAAQHTAMETRCAKILEIMRGKDAEIAQLRLQVQAGSRLPAGGGPSPTVAVAAADPDVEAVRDEALREAQAQAHALQREVDALKQALDLEKQRTVEAQRAADAAGGDAEQFERREAELRSEVRCWRVRRCLACGAVS